MSSEILRNARRFSVGNLTINTSNVVTNHYYGQKPPLDRLSDNVIMSAIHSSDARSNAPTCYPETRVAVQQDIFNWIGREEGDPRARQLLWVAGPAGAGKSAIAASLVERCEKDNVLVANFFFSVLSGKPPSRSKKRLVSTLVFQLLKHPEYDSFKNQMLSEIGRNPKIFEERVENQLEHLILLPLRAVGHGSATNRPHIILIDGFDECEAAASEHSKSLAERQLLKERAQYEVLSALMHAARDPAFPFRIIIFSRPDFAIQQFFDGHDSRTERIVLDDKYKPEADIRRFVESRFAEIFGVRLKLPIEWSPQQENAIRTIVRNSSGQFIYAAVAMNYIEQPGEPPQKKLNRILRGYSGRQAPQSPWFEPLDALYACILQTSPRPRDAVQWIQAIMELHSESGDSVNVVRGFLESGPGEMEDLLGGLSSLLSITHTFRFFHKSLLDYLGDKKRCGDLYIDSKTTIQFLQRRWYEVLKNKGPQVDLTLEDHECFLQHYVCSLTMRYFLPSNEGRCYHPGDIKWWSEVASSMQLPQRDNRATGFAVTRIAKSGERRSAMFAWGMRV
ncbi:hypothetical protein NMY22_g16638 [Coprinellus aureogranulatus]|nr:hypothetical protein NMY22_g16638 [Coprinellus aureogranulatus]